MVPSGQLRLDKLKERVFREIETRLNLVLPPASVAVNDASAAKVGHLNKLSSDRQKVHVNAIVPRKRFNCCKTIERVRKTGEFLTQNAWRSPADPLEMRQRRFAPPPQNGPDAF
ncbi:hypothetical protein RISK_004925 [Rhodopirellula islandica]|uniref:Uncharacterized protein n=1 Tax=Rhodopirellula islandica TaxID=595434 RepID=A0A0J1B812_RHOIS|nr:hypothetical protein RISK_004925 [Rhodopirellula islandica]